MAMADNSGISTMPAGDLDGLLVIAVEQAVAAPLCTSRLADAGARVIKIERPEGDFARRYDRHVNGQSTYFVWLNRGKESICLDLKAEDDRRLLRNMISRADVLVQNLAPGAMERMGLGGAALRGAFPPLITCDVSGFGVSVCDIAAGLYAHSAILQALYARQKTGEGRSIQVSLFSGMADWMNVPYLQRRYGGSIPPRAGLNHPSIAPYGVFCCRDGDLLLSVQNEREWNRLCIEVLGQPGIAVDGRYIDVTSRVANRASLDALINAAFGKRPRKEVAAALKAADIAFGLLNDVDGLIAHPQLRTITCETPEGEVTMIAPPAAVIGEAPVYRPVPAAGAHTAAIRAEFVS
jgi:itaconate CoA-transferase